MRRERCGGPGWTGDLLFLLKSIALFGGGCFFLNIALL
jgi:hypothetical protein